MRQAEPARDAGVEVGVGRVIGTEPVGRNDALSPDESHTLR